ncbi:MAG: hypothetical protein KAI43_09025 [Candidatus Aureabacteria bacterium]|nr:hypothetical protein [Candidatus Auribacterota bacterium]
MKYIMFFIVLVLSISFCGNFVLSDEIEVKKEIITLLKTRDDAVAKKDAELFSSTKLDNIKNGATKGYMKLSSLESELLGIDYLDENSKEKVVAFVKETYFFDGKKSHIGHFMFLLAKVDAKWIIFRQMSTKERVVRY